MDLRRHFTDHPAAVGETYAEHFRHASGFVRTLARATAACAVHAVVPSLCERTASAAICELHERMTAGARGRLAAPAAPSHGESPQATPHIPLAS